MDGIKSQVKSKFQKAENSSPPDASEGKKFCRI